MSGAEQLHCLSWFLAGPHKRWFQPSRWCIWTCLETRILSTDGINKPEVHCPRSTHRNEWTKSNYNQDVKKISVMNLTMTTHLSTYPAFANLRSNQILAPTSQWMGGRGSKSKIVYISIYLFNLGEKYTNHWGTRKYLMSATSCMTGTSTNTFQHSWSPSHGIETKAPTRHDIIYDIMIYYDCQKSIYI